MMDRWNIYIYVIYIYIYAEYDIFLARMHDLFL